MSKRILAASLMVLGCCSPAFAQNPQAAVNNVIVPSIGSINKCYHDRPIPWSIDFIPNSIFDVQNGTLTMATIGPAKHGTYRIVSEGGEHPTLYVDLDDGQGFKATITLYSLREMLLIDHHDTTYFHRWGL